MWQVIFYQKRNGESPVKQFLDSLNPTQLVRITRKLKLLEELGNLLRRPHADYLRDGINELRANSGKVNLRILYFFDDHIIVLACGLTKEDKVPESDIERALEYCQDYHNRKPRSSK